MQRILTGIQCTGNPHLGNILGGMLPAIELSKTPGYDAFIFLADLHTLTTIKDPQTRLAAMYSAAAAWLSIGLDYEKVVFYRQSKIPIVCELTWYLNCFTPYPMLANAHAFKDKSNRMATVTAGLFTYPTLMAADILLYQAQLIPVGKDQLQHIEITRDIASSFNNQYGITFELPKALVDGSVAIVPGIDGQKMSKSRNNTINIFLPEKELRKVIMKIQTDSKPITAVKNPDTCIVFQLYRLLAPADSVAQMRHNYLAGNYGYGQAKKALFELIMEKFATARLAYNKYMEDKQQLEEILIFGEKKATAIAAAQMTIIRSKLGY